MMLPYLVLLFVVSFIGGALPLYINIKEQYQRYILAFSGSVLLGISFLHLLPETFEDLGSKAGIYILIGFFLQLFLQKFSHGIEHGHNPNNAHHHHHHHGDEDHHHHHATPAFWGVFIGLAAHAFLEGIPLGYSFHQSSTLPNFVIGIAAHKLPETLSLMAFVAVMPFSKAKKWGILILFASISPLAGLIANYFAQQYLFTAQLISQLVPIVIGAFTHIATIIFFESETAAHQLNKYKLLAIGLGILVAISTILH
jgi:zinc and cadmium transporter